MIKSILFDVDGVITFADFDQLYTNFAERIVIEPQFVIEYHKIKLEDLLIGKATLEDFFSDMRVKVSDKSLDLQSIWLEEARKITRVDSDLLVKIDELRKKFSVGILTTVSPHREIIDEMLGIYRHFDYVILSCKEGMQKPDPRFFEIALRRAGVKAEEMVFLDDREVNVKGAQAFGIKAIHYVDKTKALEELENYILND